MIEKDEGETERGKGSEEERSQKQLEREAKNKSPVEENNKTITLNDILI